MVKQIEMHGHQIKLCPNDCPPTALSVEHDGDAFTERLNIQRRRIICSECGFNRDGKLAKENRGMVKNWTKAVNAAQKANRRQQNAKS